jgi:8-oxo-dGTP pyrophosphatase MutT (NUDIX family)
VPVVGTDAHLPPVPAARLGESALRRRFAAGDAWAPVHAGDGSVFFPDRTPAAAAVLIGLVRRPGGLRVLLTRRTEHLRDHAGQIAFPGGRSEPSDTDAAATALREAHEEIGLPPSAAEVIGAMPAYSTVTRFVVTPVVALVDAPPVWRPDPAEVAEAFEVPLAWLMDPANHRRHRFHWDGGERQFLSMPWSASGADGRGEAFIWGATAAMLRNLYHFLGA